jgi:hypothetical protein
MADFVDAQQMLVTLNNKLDWRNGLYSPVSSLNALEYPISQKLHGRQ